MGSEVLVVFSGGQDSTTCLYWAIERCGRENVLALSFDYGQRHRIELQAATAIAQLARVEHTVLPIDTFEAIGGNALLDRDQALGESATAELPTTFVPGRNLIFLTYAAALAYVRGISEIVTGVAQTDYSGYPDCREETVSALQHSLRLGMQAQFTIHTPLMHLDKRQTVLLAERLGAMPALGLSHTCYAGERPPCGSCDACRLRAKGFAEAGLDDPLLTAT